MKDRIVVLQKLKQAKLDENAKLLIAVDRVTDLYKTRVEVQADDINFHNELLSFIESLNKRQVDILNSIVTLNNKLQELKA